MDQLEPVLNVPDVTTPTVGNRCRPPRAAPGVIAAPFVALAIAISASACDSTPPSEMDERDPREERFVYVEPNCSPEAPAEPGLGAIRSWSGPEELGIAPRGSFPSVQVNGDRILVAFTGVADEHPQAHFDIHVMEATASGWSEPEIIVPVEPPARALLHPGLMVNPAGTAHLVWGINPDPAGRSPFPPRELWYTANDGDAWDEPSLLWDNAPTWLSPPSGMAEGAAGEVHVVASLSAVPGSSPRLHHIHASPSGDARVSLINEDWRGSEATLLRTQVDRLLAAFSSPLPREIDEPRDRGSILVIWSDDEGANWELPHLVREVGDFPADDPRLAQTGEGTVHLVWGRTSTSPANLIPQIYEHSVSDDGSCWSEPVQITPAAAGGVAHPVLLSDGAGGLHLFYLYMDGSPAPPFRLKYVYWDGSSWSDPEPIVELEDQAARFSVDLDDEGRAHLLFSWQGDFHYTVGSR